MKSSAIKILQSYINKKNINNFKKIVNFKNIIIGIVAFVCILSFFYFLRPVFFNYDEKKEILEKKISNHLELTAKINGDISYYFFPRPKITVKNIELILDKKNKPSLNIKKSDFLISIFKLKSLDEVKIKRIIVSNQKIKIHPNILSSYVKYYQKNNIKNITFKNCNMFFLDDQNNEIFINNFNLKNIFDGNKDKISMKGVFSQNKFKLNFLNEKNEEKHLNLFLPGIDSSLKIIFDEESNLNKNSGKLNLKISNNILIVNFDGGEVYKISDSFFRNKFLNSKLNGNINFKDNFYFDLNLNINQVNLRKLFLYYDTFARDSASGQFNISKKINGRANVKINRAESFIGRIEDTNFIILFENGDLKIKSGSSNISKNSKLKFNMSLSGKGKNQQIIFFLNFLSTKGKDFLKKLNLTVEDEDLSFNSVGKINVLKKEIKFENLTVNKEKMIGKNLNTIENLFNEHVIEDNILGFLDFFKIKKFSSKLSDAFD
tara:strand:+ start:1405 stop:2874 length:1470 start_codon:yes stop_codon:yes gene_type:complete